MNRPTEGRILLVGEGNFSLSASLVEGGTISGPQLTATCFDTFIAVQEAHRLAASNIEFLEKAGATVLFEVDATDLHNHQDIKFFEFERVIFNFPLADRHNIKKNRALLSDFFSSVKNILDPKGGQVMVTLCKGQGGTPADQPMRSWHDSWQVVSMAANASLILTQIYPFEAKDFPRYESVGFRFQDKGFNTDNALIHVFEMARTVSIPEVDARRRFIRQGNVDFVVTSYIRRKLDRWSLLEKERHPLCSLHHLLVTRLSHTYPTIAVLPCNHPSLPRVLCGYRSLLHLQPSHDEGARMGAEDTGEVAREAKPIPVMGGGDHGLTGKELKDMQNLEKANASVKGSGADGCTSGGDGSLADQTSSKSSSQSAGCSPGSNLSMKPFQHGMAREGGVGEDGDGGGSLVATQNPAADILLPFISRVFVVHKMPQSQNPESGENGGPGLHADATQNAEEKVVDSGHEDGDNMDTAESASDTASGIRQQPNSSASPSEKKETHSDPQLPSAETLFHLRCSLLENLAQLDRYMTVKSSKAVLMSGIVFRQCPISSFELPVSHETVILSKSDNETVDDLANQLCAAIRVVMGEETAVTVKVKDSLSDYTLGEKSHINVTLTLQAEGAPKFATLGEVFRFEASDCAALQSGQQAATPQEPCRTLIGAVLYLDNIACLALRLPDVRLLWSEDERFISQFSVDSSPLSFFPAYKPFSLYPVRCVHDLSFWENADRVFEETDFLDVVREVADDCVTSVSLVDKFESADLGKTSRCYRLVFQSHDRVLSYITSWKLQSVLRLKVAHRMGVLLR